jgi:nitrite reductase/ring-hydroxylating ferredoxin subunit
MDHEGEWIDVGAREDFQARVIARGEARRRLVAVSFKGWQVRVISNVCNHVGGPLGKGPARR